jgi:UMF1 family MFS transporter
MGNRNAVMLGLLVWCGLLFYAWLGVRGETGFYALAGAAGTVMGGTQALSRSVFSFMIPKGREAEYFSIYEISDKGTSWLGPLLVGLALEWTGNFRIAILSLILFFLIGLAFLARVNVRQAAIEAGNEPPAK